MVTQFKFLSSNPVQRSCRYIVRAKAQSIIINSISTCEDLISSACGALVLGAGVLNPKPPVPVGQRICYMAACMHSFGIF